MGTTPSQTLTPHQSDLLLDTLEACRNVGDLFQLKEQTECDGSSDADVIEVTKLYDTAVEKAADVYGEAVNYVPASILDPVADAHLPEHLLIEGVNTE